MAFVRGRTSFEERFVEAAVPLTATSLTAGSRSRRMASGQPAPATAAPEPNCASVLSLAGGAAGAGPCQAPVGSAGGLRGVGARSASAVGAVRDCSGREDPMSDMVASVVPAPEPTPQRRVARSSVSRSRNLRSFTIALLFVALAGLFACAIALLIAQAFYGYGGLG